MICLHAAATERGQGRVIVYFSTTLANELVLNVLKTPLTILTLLLMLLMPESAQLLLHCEGNYLVCHRKQGVAQTNFS